MIIDEIKVNLFATRKVQSDWKIDAHDLTVISDLSDLVRVPRLYGDGALVAGQ